jgi:hypothetical protein
MVNHYELTGFNSSGVFEEKNKIIIGNTNRDYKNYINSLRYRYNKKNPYLPNYVINKDGDIYEIISSDMYSKYMDDEQISKESVIILLENLGWLKKNPLNNTFTNWIGDIYKKEVFEKRWRNEIYWDIYSQKQIESLAKLIVNICEKHNITKKMVESNVLFDEAKLFKGITSKSNYYIYHKDVNPSFDFKLLKKFIDNE